MCPLNSISHPWPSSRGTEMSLRLWEVGCLQKTGWGVCDSPGSRLHPHTKLARSNSEGGCSILSYKRKVTPVIALLLCDYCILVQSHLWLTLLQSQGLSAASFLCPWIVQARTLEWVDISYSRRSSQPRDRTHVSSTGRCLLYNWATWEAWLQLVLASSSQPDSLTDLSMTFSPFRLWLLNPPQLSFCLKYHRSYTRFSYFPYIPTSSSLFPQTCCVKRVPWQRPTQVSMWC